MVVVRLKVQDRNKFITDMSASGAAVRGLGNEVERTGGLFRSGTHHGFLWNQMLFTLRRGIYSVTLALGAMGAAAVVIGFKFDSMLEQQSLAFRRFTGSVAGAKREVDFLFNLAAHGPFQFQQVIAASRQLMAFGFSVQRTNFLLNNLQDAMAGMGLDQAALDRATLALGQIQSSGRLLGQDLRQLEQLGLVNPQDLARRLNIDPRQIANVGQLNIPSEQAIDAIVAYWRSRFQGAAKDFQKTWVGQWSTFKDVASQTMGFVVQGLMNRLETQVMPALTSVFTVAGQGARTGGARGAFSAIDAKYGTDTTAIYKSMGFVLNQLVGIFHSLAIIVYTAWKRLANFGALTKILLVFGGALWFINHALQFLGPYLSYIVSVWLAYRTALILVTIAQWLQTTAIYAYYTALGLAVVITNIYRYAQLGLFIVQVALTAGMSALRDALLMMTLAMEENTAAAAALNFVLALNPFVLIGLAVIALIAGLVLLYYKWGWFHRAVQNTFDWINAHKNLIYDALKFSFLPIFLAIKGMQELIKHFQTFKDLLHGNIADAAGIPRGHWYSQGGIGHMLGLPDSITGYKGAAVGAHVLTGGGLLVGERGPELVSLPAGATVAPLGGNPVASLGGILGKATEKTLNLRIPVYLDRRQLGEAMASYQLDVAAGT